MASGLPREARQFAQQLGLDLAGLEPEAEEIWRRLDRLASSSPEEYQRFVAAQISAAESDPGERSRPSFRPLPGFCVRTTTSGGDGILVREGGEGKPLYVNFCSHAAVQRPKTKGRPLEDLLTADGLEVPLLLGAPRELEVMGQESICLDAVLHPEVIAQVLVPSLPGCSADHRCHAVPALVGVQGADSRPRRLLDPAGARHTPAAPLQGGLRCLRRGSG